MRIWAFPSFYPYDYPGKRWTGTFAHRQYKGLINAGAELIVIQPVLWWPPFPFSQLAPDWKQSAAMGHPLKREYDGVTVYHPRIENIKPGRLMKHSYTERYIHAVGGLLKDLKVTLDPANDIFFSQWLPESIFVQKAAHRLGVKSAILGIGDDIIIWPHESPRKMEEFKELINEADLRITNADYLGREICKLMDRAVPYSVSYFGVDHDVFKPVSLTEKNALRKAHNIPLDKTVILIVGSALKRKGWLDLMDALVTVKNAGDDFLLVGGYAGMSDVDVLREIEKRDLLPYFYNQGEIKPEQLNIFYNMADIFCLPSHWEGLATVVMEAMSSGIPVITTNICGQPEIVSHNTTGILVEPKAVPALAAEIQALLRSRERRETLGAAAREFIVNTWGNYNKNSHGLYGLLQHALQAGS